MKIFNKFFGRFGKIAQNDKYDLMHNVRVANASAFIQTWRH